MKAIVQSTYFIREKPVHSYHSFPQFSPDIESTMCRLLEFLKKQDSSFNLELRIEHAN